jgi:hypothetical protein
VTGAGADVTEETFGGFVVNPMDISALVSFLAT